MWVCCHGVCDQVFTSNQWQSHSSMATKSYYHSHHHHHYHHYYDKMYCLSPINENHIFPWQLSLHNFPFQQLHLFRFCLMLCRWFLLLRWLNMTRKSYCLNFKIMIERRFDWMIWIMIVVFHRCTLVRSGGLARQPRATQHQHQPNSQTLSTI